MPQSIFSQVLLPNMRRHPLPPTLKEQGDLAWRPNKDKNTDREGKIICTGLRKPTYHITKSDDDSVIKNHIKTLSESLAGNDILIQKKKIKVPQSQKTSDVYIVHSIGKDGKYFRKKIDDVVSQFQMADLFDECLPNELDEITKITESTKERKVFRDVIARAGRDCDASDIDQKPSFIIKGDQTNQKQPLYIPVYAISSKKYKKDGYTIGPPRIVILSVGNGQTVESNSTKRLMKDLANKNVTVNKATKTITPALVLSINPANNSSDISIQKKEEKAPEHVSNSDNVTGLSIRAQAELILYLNERIDLTKIPLSFYSFSMGVSFTVDALLLAAELAKKNNVSIPNVESLILINGFGSLKSVIEQGFPKLVHIGGALGLMNTGDLTLPVPEKTLPKLDSYYKNTKIVVSNRTRDNAIGKPSLAQGLMKNLKNDKGFDSYQNKDDNALINRWIANDGKLIIDVVNDDKDKTIVKIDKQYQEGLSTITLIKNSNVEAPYKLDNVKKDVSQQDGPSKDPLMTTYWMPEGKKPTMKDELNPGHYLYKDEKENIHAMIIPRRISGKNQEPFFSEDINLTKAATMNKDLSKALLTLPSLQDKKPSTSLPKDLFIVKDKLINDCITYKGNRHYLFAEDFDTALLTRFYTLKAGRYLYKQKDPKVDRSSVHVLVINKAGSASFCQGFNLSWMAHKAGNNAILEKLNAMTFPSRDSMDESDKKRHYKRTTKKDDFDKEITKFINKNCQVRYEGENKASIFIDSATHHDHYRVHAYNGKGQHIELEIKKSLDQNRRFDALEKQLNHLTNTEKLAPCVDNYFDSTKNIMPIFLLSSFIQDGLSRSDKKSLGICLNARVIPYQGHNGSHNAQGPLNYSNLVRSQLDFSTLVNNHIQILNKDFGKKTLDENFSKNNIENCASWWDRLKSKVTRPSYLLMIGGGLCIFGALAIGAATGGLGLAALGIGAAAIMGIKVGISAVGGFMVGLLLGTSKIEQSTPREKSDEARRSSCQDHQSTEAVAKKLFQKIEPPKDFSNKNKDKNKKRKKIIKIKRKNIRQQSQSKTPEKNKPGGDENTSSPFPTNFKR